MVDAKPVHSLVLDAGPIIKNDPPVSTLLQKAEALFTTPAIISEIKDASARSRVDTTLKPFLTVRSPGPGSVKIVADFARRTGDLGVLSKNDIDIIALTYELECERNSGNWRLRSAPGQKGLNGRPPNRTEAVTASIADLNLSNSTSSAQDAATRTADHPHLTDSTFNTTSLASTDSEANPVTADTEVAPQSPAQAPRTASAAQDDRQGSDSVPAPESSTQSPPPTSNDLLETAEDSSSDSDGWITPANLKKRQAQDANSSVIGSPEQATLQAAVLTTDFAMQNVILQMNLNLLSSSLQRVKHLKTFVLRCHACFQVTKEMTRQFCPRCGGPTLTRVSCSTDANGEFKLHLRKNMQWNHRGDRYSIPKPMHGSANGRNKGGGKNGWGHELILAEDQKEYERAGHASRKHKEKSLMDEDYLPSILTGDRGKEGGRTKVGAGRNINSRKR